MLKTIAELAGKSVLGNLAESFIDNVIRDKVTPVPGSVVYCELAYAVEHSGIYIGDPVILSTKPNKFSLNLKPTSIG